MGSGTWGARPSEPPSLSGICCVSLFALSDSLTHSSCIPTAAAVRLTSFTPPPQLPCAHSPFRARSPSFFISKRGMSQMECLSGSEAPRPCLLSVCGLAALGLGVRGVQMDSGRRWVVMSYRARVCSTGREARLPWGWRLPRVRVHVRISAALTTPSPAPISCRKVMHPPECWVRIPGESLRRVHQGEDGEE